MSSTIVYGAKKRGGLYWPYIEAYEGARRLWGYSIGGMSNVRDTALAEAKASAEQEANLHSPRPQVSERRPK